MTQLIDPNLTGMVNNKISPLRGWLVWGFPYRLLFIRHAKKVQLTETGKAGPDARSYSQGTDAETLNLYRDFSPLPLLLTDLAALLCR